MSEAIRMINVINEAITEERNRICEALLSDEVVDVILCAIYEEWDDRISAEQYENMKRCAKAVSTAVTAYIKGEKEK